MSTSPQRGFTLVELIVSVGLFALVMLVATSAYYKLIALDRQARATNVLVNNLSFVVDAMTRGIRTGTGYQCVATGGNSTDGSCNCFSYSDSNLNTIVTYHLNTTDQSIERRTGASASCADGGNDVTDPLVNVTALRFYVRGVGSSDAIQPQVLFTISGNMPSSSQGGTSQFVIEENATQRLIDL